jgi:hypothetical protein
MRERYESRHELINDKNIDTRNDAGTEAKVDYGGLLAGDIGVNLNAGVDSSVGAVENEPIKEIGINLNRLPNENINKYTKDQDYEQIDIILNNFQREIWSDLSLDEQKRSMIDLADYVATDTKNNNPPEIVFSNDMPDGSYGGYSPDSNIIEINVNMLDDSMEAADTIAHEMWHAYQEQAVNDPNNPRAQEYQEGFDNYISPEYDFEGYQNQMVESEARDYAQGYKDKLAG